MAEKRIRVDKAATGIVTGRCVQVIGNGMGSGSGQLCRPSGVAIGWDGDLYVADHNNWRIQVFRHDGTFLRKWGGYGSGKGEFSGFMTLAMGHRPGIHPAVLVALSGDRVISQWPPGLAKLCADYMGNEQLFVMDAHVRRVQAFETDGKLLRQWGKLGRGCGEFDFPIACTTTVEGTFYVADYINCNVQVFDINSQFLFRWSVPSTPVGIAATDDRKIYVSVKNDYPHPSRIHHYLENGLELGTFSSCGEVRGSLILSDAPGGRVCVLTEPSLGTSRRVIIVSADGCIQHQWEETNISGLNGYIRCSPYGSLYIVDPSNHRILRMDSSGLFSL